MERGCRLQFSSGYAYGIIVFVPRAAARSDL